MSTFRTETDSFGSIQVPGDCYWGANTQRALDNFRIGEEPMPLSLIWALGIQKRACAEVNKDLGLLDPVLGDAIIRAAQRVADGLLNHHFPLSVWQSGSGTQTHMNVNEVIANRAIEFLGGDLGNKKLVHPNVHVNLGQSSNDSFPTAMHIATVLALQHQLFPALVLLEETLAAKAESFSDMIKIGRTHLQDAVPLRLGQEFGAFAFQMAQNSKRIRETLPDLYALAQGGTAVGTGLNAPHDFGKRVAEQISYLTGLPFTSNPNIFEALASHDPLMMLSGALSTLGASLMKMGNDIRLLGSGPRCGLGELLIPENEPGSSIMLGKVNPTQIEALTMVAAQVMGHHTAIAFANSLGQLQLNVFKPLIISNALSHIHLLAGSMGSLVKNCLQGLHPNPSQMQHYLERSLMLVTALTPHIGYDKAAFISQKAAREGITLREAALELEYVSADQFDLWANPAAMV